MVKSTGVEIRFSMVAGEDHSDCRGARENAILDAAIELIAEVGYVNRPGFDGGSVYLFPAPVGTLLRL